MLKVVIEKTGSYRAVPELINIHLGHFGGRIR
jgi:hypothetical protein